MALELTAALRERGHLVTAWSPSPLPGRPRGLKAIRAQNRAIEEFLEHSDAFDVLDVPCVSLTHRVARQGFAVSRSVQPDIEYMAAEIRHSLRVLSPWLLIHMLRVAYMRPAVLSGWRRADRILCLGSIERTVMETQFPAWRSKIVQYWSAPPAEDRALLLSVRRTRLEHLPRQAREALWIGRWAAQKGTDRLVRLLARLVERTDLRFTIAGAGDAPFRAIPEVLLKTGRVKIVPTFERSELPDLLAANDIGLFTSTVEGWGVSVSEMLESGLTVYAQRVGSVADLQPYFPNTLRPLTEIETLAIGDPEDLAANGYLRSFSWGAIAERYEKDILDPARRVIRDRKRR
jgi:glycosyltransferase involved in cell wall biosynthesis